MDSYLEIGPEEKAVVLFSGGQDSTTCLYWAKERFADLTALLIHYGQRHAIEAEQARIIAAEAEVTLVEQHLELTSLLAVNSLTDASKELTSTLKTDGSLPDTFVPGRNLLFLTLAGMLAYRLSAHHIVTGVCQTDFSGYPDCRLDFVESAQESLRLATSWPYLVHTPLMFLDKAQTWLLAEQLGCLETVTELSHTCYAGDREHLHPWGKGCGTCEACQLRKKGWEEAFGKRL